MQKRLNRSICHLGCGLGWAEGTTSSVVFAGGTHVPSWEGTWRHLANMIELSIWGGDVALCHCQITLTSCLS